MAGLEGVGDVLEEDQAEGDMLVVARLHVAAQLVGGFEQLGFEAEIAAVAALARISLCHLVISLSAWMRALAHLGGPVRAFLISLSRRSGKGLSRASRSIGTLLAKALYCRRRN